MIVPVRLSLRRPCRLLQSLVRTAGVCVLLKLAEGNGPAGLSVNDAFGIPIGIQVCNCKAVSAMSPAPLVVKPPPPEKRTVGQK